MELAKKPVLFLCIASADTFRISVPKTEHHYLFYRGQPYLVKFNLDIEFFDEHLKFDRVDKVEDEETTTDFESETKTDASAIVEDVKSETTTDERPPYDKKELQKMRKSDVREILKKLNPEKSCPIRKENIIKEVLKAQRSK